MSQSRRSRSKLPAHLGHLPSAPLAVHRLEWRLEHTEPPTEAPVAGVSDKSIYSHHDILDSSIYTIQALLSRCGYMNRDIPMMDLGSDVSTPNRRQGNSVHESLAVWLLRCHSLLLLIHYGGRLPRTFTLRSCLAVRTQGEFRQHNIYPDAILIHPGCFSSLLARQLRPTSAIPLLSPGIGPHRMLQKILE